MLFDKIMLQKRRKLYYEANATRTEKIGVETKKVWILEVYRITFMLKSQIPDFIV